MLCNLILRDNHACAVDRPYTVMPLAIDQRTTRMNQPYGRIDICLKEEQTSLVVKGATPEIKTRI
ncbi:MAG: hypothetical protein KME45_08635 [Stenomitos rutilans HA7619-LM2]|nr:hypothetical protein [Stenomitos rutilans HA7619-LM2]